MDDIEDFLDTQSRLLVRPMETLRALGNDIGSAPDAEALDRLRAACQFCSDTLLPLLEAHETLLDPAVTGLPGGLDVGHALGAERLRLRGFVAALSRRLEEGRLDPQARAALRRELYLLHAVCRGLPRSPARAVRPAAPAPPGRRLGEGPRRAAPARVPLAPDVLGVSRRTTTRRPDVHGGGCAGPLQSGARGP